MFINFHKFERVKLSEKQKEFLHVLVPFGRIVQEYTKNKCKLSNINSKYGIFASIVIADVIIKSDWGTHKIAKKYNNLNLLEANDFWYGKTKQVDDKEYKTYDCWFDYAADLSDHFVFSGDYLPVLISKNLDDQIDSIVLLNEQYPTYHSKIELLIESLGLWEFDIS